MLDKPNEEIAMSGALVERSLLLHTRRQSSTDESDDTRTKERRAKKVHKRKQKRFVTLRSSSRATKRALDGLHSASLRPENEEEEDRFRQSLSLLSCDPSHSHEVEDDTKCLNVTCAALRNNLRRKLLTRTSTASTCTDTTLSTKSSLTFTTSTASMISNTSLFSSGRVVVVADDRSLSEGRSRIQRGRRSSLDSEAYASMNANRRRLLKKSTERSCPNSIIIPQANQHAERSERVPDVSRRSMFQNSTLPSHTLATSDEIDEIDVPFLGIRRLSERRSDPGLRLSRSQLESTSLLTSTADMIPSHRTTESSTVNGSSATGTDTPDRRSSLLDQFQNLNIRAIETPTVLRQTVSAGNTMNSASSQIPPYQSEERSVFTRRLVRDIEELNMRRSRGSTTAASIPGLDFPQDLINEPARIRYSALSGSSQVQGVSAEPLHQESTAVPSEEGRFGHSHSRLTERPPRVRRRRSRSVGSSRVSTFTSNDGSYVGPSALYHAVSSRAPRHIIVALLETDPDATAQQNGGGLTPLHCGVDRYDTSLDVLKLLLEANPPTASMKNSKGLTPVDLLWKRFIDPEDYRGQEACEAAATLKALIEKAVSCENGPLPRTVAGESNRAMRHLEAKRKINSLQTLRKNEDLREFWDLMALFIKAAHHGTLENNDSMKVVHAAVAHPCDPLMVNFAMALYPEQLRERENGSLPLHVAINALAHDEAKSRTIINLLLSANSKAASCCDKNGTLPLHVAIKNGIAWDAGVRALFEASPRALVTHDINTHMLPFMTSAIQGDLDCTFLLLRECPISAVVTQ